MAALSVSAKGGYWEQFNNSIMDLDNDNPIKRRIARLYDREGMRAYKELSLELTGAAVGATASATHKQVLARENAEGQLGGVRTIETVTDVNRVTATADLTDLDDKVLAFPSEPTTYPVNGDGNPRQYPGG